MKTLILIFVLLATTCLYSTIINVPGDQPTIQAGIDAAADTDTVLVADGTYFENIDFIGKAITVASNFLINGDTLHIANTIINGSQTTNPDFGSCVRFTSNEDTTSVITGFTLTEGSGCLTQPINANVGGGIFCDNSSPKIISNIVTNNSPDYAGGIGISNASSPIVLNNVISYNTVTYNNGGISIVYNSNPYLEGNIISNNTTNNLTGGILIYTGSSPTLVDNIIRENSAAGAGGGVVIQLGCNPVFLNNIICNNTAGTYGGGIYIVNSNVNLSYTSIYGNSASMDGGGIEIWDSFPVITNCTIYGNEAPGCGSQIDCWSGGLEAINSFIGGNSTNGSVYFNTSAPTFDYCDFYNSDGPDFDGPSVPTTLGVITTVNYNGDPCDVFMNIFLDPLFVDPANGDYHLTEFSPCIDAGDPASPPDPDGSIVDISKLSQSIQPDDNYKLSTSRK
jgi:parallel beta-helix repeat protein